MKFIIDRKTWLRGEGVTPSRLLRPSDGKKCCMGQICQRLGVGDEALVSRKTVAGLYSLAPALLMKNGDAKDFELDWVRSGYGINDDAGIADAEREQQLQVLAASAGHELEFVG